MKKIFTLLVIILITTACGNKAYKTTANLKEAANGEITASVMYAKFAEKAVEDSMFRVAAMFHAMSASENVHAQNHLTALKELGEEFVPTIGEITVNSTVENIQKAKSGEMYEIEKMYPAFIETAEAEGLESALKSFRFANMVEGKHNLFCDKALSDIEMNQGKDTTFNAEWVVCPVCGDTYIKSEIESSCDICQTPIDKFIMFSI